MIDRLVDEQAAVYRFAVGRRDARGQREGALLHKLLAGVAGCAQELLRRGVLRRPCQTRRRVDAVVLAECTLPQAELGLDEESHVAVDLRYFQILRVGRHVLGGEVEVFEDLLADILARVACLVETLVVGLDHVVVVGNGTEELHLGKVVPCTPEAGYTLVVVVYLLAQTRHVAEVVEEILDVVDEVPVVLAPRALLRRGPCRLQEVVLVTRLNDVAVTVVGVGYRAFARGIGFEKTVGVLFQRIAVFPVCSGVDGCGIVTLHPLFASGRRYRGRH